MSLTLYAHPFSSYSIKALIALYETAAPFTFRDLSPADPAAGAELAGLWPLRRFPVLRVRDPGAADRTLMEASIIVEYVDQRFGGATPLIPRDADAALEVRMRDRLFDNYVMTPMQAIVADVMRLPAERDRRGVAAARDLLGRAYAWLDGEMNARQWAVGETFTLADCAAAPALFYADWVQPIAPELRSLIAYRARLNARPSFARCIEEARPHRHLFPPGAPDRD